MNGIERLTALAAVVLLLLSGLGTTQPANAGASGMAKIAGMAVSCTDYRGRSVHTMRVSNLGDVARAWVVNRMPFIVMDRGRLAKLPPKLQLFFYGHECAHHKMGHWMNTTMDSEREADCFAIRNGRDSGLFTRDEVASFAPFFAASRGSNYGHLPGPERARFLLTCFDDDSVLGTLAGAIQARRERTIVNSDARE